MTDSAGPYDRPDIFELSIDRRRRRVATYLDDGATPAARTGD